MKKHLIPVVLILTVAVLIYGANNFISAGKYFNEAGLLFFLRPRLTISNLTEAKRTKHLYSGDTIRIAMKASSELSFSYCYEFKSPITVEDGKDGKEIACEESFSPDANGVWARDFTLDDTDIGKWKVWAQSGKDRSKTVTFRVSLNPTDKFFEVGFGGDPGVLFVIKLTNENKISKARNIITSKSEELVIGTINKERVYYNKNWSYHYDPETIDFAELAAEVCDASPMGVEEHLKEVGGAFLPNSRWCPWTSFLVREIAKPKY